MVKIIHLYTARLHWKSNIKPHWENTCRFQPQGESSKVGLSLIIAKVHPRPQKETYPIVNRNILQLNRKNSATIACIGVDLGGSPGTCSPIIEKRPCIYHFLPPFAPPNILDCPPNIFDKSTPVATSNGLVGGGLK